MPDVVIYLLPGALIAFALGLIFKSLYSQLQAALTNVELRVEYYKERVNKLELRVAVLESEIGYQDYKKSLIGEETRLK